MRSLGTPKDMHLCMALASMHHSITAAADFHGHTLCLGPREVIVGTAGKLMAMPFMLMRSLAERIYRKVAEIDHFEEVPTPSTDGNGATGGRVPVPMPQHVLDALMS
jgi:hypothetical protein